MLEITIPFVSLDFYATKLHTFVMKNYKEAPGYSPDSIFYPDEFIRVWISENPEDAIKLCKLAVELVTTIRGDAVTQPKKV